MTTSSADQVATIDAPPAPPRLRRWMVRGLLVLGALVGVLIAWFIISRATAPLRAVRVVSSSTTAPAVPRPTLRIACWNIAHGRGLAESNYDGGDAEARRDRLDRIASVLRSADLDAVVINEIDFHTHWSQNVNQAAVLAEAAGFPHRVEQCNLDASLPFWSLRIGNAILSRHRIEDAALIDLPSPDTWEKLAAGHKRGAVCTIRPPGMPPFRLIALHLDHRRESVRIASAEVVNGIIGSSSLPVVVAGDLNSTRADYPNAKPDPAGRTALQVMVDSGRLALAPQVRPDEPWFTYRADNPNRVIDWILAPPDWRVVEYEVIPTDLSDHRLVVATLEPPRQPPSPAATTRPLAK